MVQIELSSYQLKGKKERKSRVGCLLKVTSKTGAVGYSDCHLWPELGDPTVLEIMEQIRLNEYDHPYIRRMIANSSIDSNYRQLNRPFGCRHSLMANHYLFQQVESITTTTLERLASEGFTHLKLKVGREVEKEVEKIIEHFSGDSSFKLRLDFNSLLKKDRYIEMITTLTKHKVSIEFCEDPFPYDHLSWIQVQKKTAIQIAADRYVKELYQQKEFPFVVIIKPAVDDVIKIATSLRGQKFVVTSYLDHPVGQVNAAFHAQLLDRKFPKNRMAHGLLSHHLYEPNEYSLQLAQKGPYFLYPKGAGVGFEELLRREKWIK